MNKRTKYTTPEIYTLIKRNKGNIFKVAEANGETPYSIFRAWQSRFVVGSFKNYKDAEELDNLVHYYYESKTSFNKETRQRKNNKELRKENNRLINQEILFEDIRKEFAKDKVRKLDKTKPDKKNNYSMEILLSDIHVGKQLDNYNTNIAGQKLDHYANRIVELQKIYKPRRTLVSILGDEIENSSKHVDSREGCDSPTAVQLVNASRFLRDFFVKIYKGAGDLTVAGVPGNHENVYGKGSAMNYRGKVHLSYTIYQYLKDTLSQNKIKWIIPSGNYARFEWNKNVYVIEHGDNVKATPDSMQTQLDKRNNQAKSFAEFFRMGDKHHVVIAHRGKLITNGAFFSDKSGVEFSGASGYSSDPAQVALIYNKNEVDSVSIINI